MILSFQVRYYIEMKINILSLFFNPKETKDDETKEKISNSVTNWEIVKLRIENHTKNIDEEKGGLWARFEKMYPFTDIIENNKEIKEIKQLISNDKGPSLSQKLNFHFIHHNMWDWFSFELFPNERKKQKQNIINIKELFEKFECLMKKIISKVLKTTNYLKLVKGKYESQQKYHPCISKPKEKDGGLIICHNGPKKYSISDNSKEYDLEEKDLCTYCAIYIVNISKLFEIDLDSKNIEKMVQKWRDVRFKNFFWEFK